MRSVFAAAPDRLRLLRWTIDGVRIAGLSIVVGLIALLHVGPVMGVQPVAIRGASMEPAISLGSLAIVTRRDPANVVVGEVISRRADNGVLVTHRTTRVEQIDGRPHFETKGDASATADPVLAAPDEVAGVVAVSVPVAGYLVVLLSKPLGLVGIAALLLGLTVAAELIEDLEWSRATATRFRPPRTA